jgi:hypothetical protein
MKACWAIAWTTLSGRLILSFCTSNCTDIMATWNLPSCYQSCGLIKQYGTIECGVMLAPTIDTSSGAYTMINTRSPLSNCSYSLHDHFSILACQASNKSRCLLPRQLLSPSWHWQRLVPKPATANHPTHHQAATNTFSTRKQMQNVE